MDGFLVISELFQSTLFPIYKRHQQVTRTVNKVILLCQTFHFIEVIIFLYGFCTFWTNIST